MTTKSPRLWSTGDLHSPRIGTPTCHYVINVSEGKTALCFIAVLQNGSMWYLNQKGCPLSEGYINIYYFNLLCTTKENKPGSLFLRSIWNIHNLLFGCFIRTESSSHVSLCENRELGNFKIMFQKVLYHKSVHSTAELYDLSAGSPLWLNAGSSTEWLTTLICKYWTTIMTYDFKCSNIYTPKGKKLSL